MAVLNQSGHLELGNLSPLKPYLYFMIVIILSVFMGIWGFFVYIDIAKRNGLLAGHQYRTKGALLKIIIILINVQGRDAALAVSKSHYMSTCKIINMTEHHDDSAQTAVV